MGIKPVVILALPPRVASAMFVPADMDRLRDVTNVIGPFESKDPNLKRALATAEVAITGWSSPPFDAALLDGATSLKLVAHSAGSVKGVATEHAFDRGIRVTTAAAANAVPVAEFTVAMMVVMLKQVPWLVEHVRSGRWQGFQGPVRELRDINVGLIAASRVGLEVIRLLGAYPRVHIKLYDPYVSPERARQLGIELVSLDDACRCEVVSVHAPQIPETRQMFNARTLGLMPDHGIFINTSRGSLVDEAALVAEVRRRPIYACLDVTDPEPPAPDSPMRREPHILLTPHIAGSIKQARTDMGRLAIDETLRFLSGQPLQHEVTKAMLATQA